MHQTGQPRMNLKQCQWNSSLTKLLKTINCRQFQAVPCKGRARPPCHPLSNQFESQIILLYIMLAGTWQSLGELAVVQEVNAGVLISHCQLAAKRLACAHTLHCSSTQDSESKTSTISRTKGAGAAAFSCAPQGWGSCRCAGPGDARDEGRQRAKANGRHCHADSRHDQRLSRSNFQPGSEKGSWQKYLQVKAYETICVLSFHAVVLKS